MRNIPGDISRAEKSNFSLYDNLGYIEAKTYILEEKVVPYKEQSLKL